jgi:Na+-transporting NADH:ubiquinone oxidoreductase subunit C
MPRDSVSHTFKIAFALCLICSLLVSAAAVGLRSFQRANKQRELRKNVLLAAGLFDPAEHSDEDVARLFERVEVQAVDLETGEVVEASEFVRRLAEENLQVPSMAEYDARQASRQEGLSLQLPVDEDPASVRRRERYALVYRVDAGGAHDLVVLPIRGYGLWSTLYGFLSIDVNSLQQGPEHAIVRGLTYYEHGETPGLGGEVDNPTWKSKWEGKHLFDSEWNVIIEVAKAITEPEHQVDALSGATITSNGVTYMLQFWLGERGFGPYLKRLAAEPDAPGGQAGMRVPGSGSTSKNG